MNDVTIITPISDLIPELSYMNGEEFGQLISEIRDRNPDPSNIFFAEDMRDQMEEADIVWLKALVEALEKEPQP